MVTTNSEVARLSLHRLATARTRALHSDERLLEAVVEVMDADPGDLALTPREELKKKS